MIGPPVGVEQSVENVPLERPVGQTRVVEIVLRCARHAEALHDPARAPVGGNRQRDDLAQAEFIEAVI